MLVEAENTLWKQKKSLVPFGEIPFANGNAHRIIIFSQWEDQASCFVSSIDDGLSLLSSTPLSLT
jgi:hypothetical protein